MRPFHVRLRRAFRLAALEMLGARSAYDAADMNRILADWIASCRSPDQEIRGNVRRLRARARELARNNSYVKRYFRLLTNNVIGPMGIKLQAQVRKSDRQLDETTNTAIEEAWREWASHPVTVDGRTGLREFEKLLLKTWACDGEIFVRLWRGYEGNPFGLALQPIDADLIDVTYNRGASPSSNEIRMGVEVDKIGRPVGYWVWNMTQSAGIDVYRERYFVPADEMIHIYSQDRVNQTRGVTWIHAAMGPAHMLNAYEESEAIASRVAAAKMGFIEKKGDGFGAGGASGKKNLKMEASPGAITRLDEGWGFTGWSPDHPTGQFPAFVKQMLRKVSSGLSVFYNVLANDAEQVTYSTMRSFALIERDDWQSLQQDFIDMWRRPLYDAWLRMALLTGRLKLASKNPGRYMAVRHRPRGWPWIDPQKETKAAVMAIENGLGTRTSFLAEKGEDVEEVFRELKRELELAAELGLTIDGGAADDDRLTKEEWEEQQAEETETSGGNGDGRELAERPQRPTSSSPRQQSPAN